MVQFTVQAKEALNRTEPNFLHTRLDHIEVELQAVPDSVRSVQSIQVDTYSWIDPEYKVGKRLLIGALLGFVSSALC